MARKCKPPKRLATAIATLAALSPATAQDETEYFTPGQPGWPKLFAVDVAPAPLRTLTDRDTPLPAPEAAARYAVSFEGEVMEFDVGGVLIEALIGDNAYDLRYEMRQRGIAKFFSDGSAEAHAAGTFDTDDPARPIDGSYYFNHDYESEDDQQRVELYRPKGERRLRLWAEPEYDYYQSVTEDLALGATDPLGALIALGFGEAAPGHSPCERQAKVYDGRRRFDLTFTPEGTKTFDPSGDGRFVGETYECRMTLTKVAGYRPKDRAEMDGSLWVYLAPVPEAVRTPTFAYVPVHVRGRQGIFGASLKARYPTITAPDGTVYPLYED